MTDIKTAIADLGRIYKKAEEEARDKSNSARELGFLHAASDHKLVADLYKNVQAVLVRYLEVDTEASAVSTYNVSKSVLVEDIARQNCTFVNGRPPMGYFTKGDDLYEAYAEEADIMYEFLLEKGWTPPTI